MNRPTRNYEQTADELRAAYAEGMSPVPHSVYNRFSPRGQNNENIIAHVRNLLRDAAISQAHTNSAVMNATTALNNAKTSLDGNTRLRVDAADSLAVAATLFTDAAETSPRNDIKAMLTNAATNITNAATSLTDDGNTDTANLMSNAAESLNAVATASEAKVDHSIVFIYELDEISMLARNYVGEFLTKFPEIRSDLLRVFVDRILKRAHFNSPEELSEGDIVSLADVILDETEVMRRIVPKYYNLLQTYNNTYGTPPNGPIISSELLRDCNMGHRSVETGQAAEQLQPKINQRWRWMKQCLDIVNKKTGPNKKFANVVITELGIGFGAAHLIASGHSPFIPMGNIFSTAKTSKEQVINRIRRRFGETCIFVYVFSPQTSNFPQTPNVFPWKVEAADSIEALYNAQRDHFLR